MPVDRRNHGSKRLATILMALCASPAGGQESQPHDSVPNRDGPLFSPSSYVAAVGGDDLDRRLELALNGHFRVSPRTNGGDFYTWLRNGVREDSSSAPEPMWRLTWTWSFGFMAREHRKIDGEEVASSPIRSPSLTWDWFPIPEVFRLSVSEQRAGLLMLGLHLRHYSNGQAGCFLDGYARQVEGRPHPGGECTRVAPGSGRDRLNTVNGSFSTNYWSARLGHEWIQRAENGGIDSSIGFISEFRLHRLLCTCLPGNPDRDMLDRYGRYEVVGRGWYRSGPEGWQDTFLWGRDVRGPLLLELEGLGRLGAPQQLRPQWGGSVALKWLIFGEGEAGPFVRFYRGSNYYNIDFESPLEDFFLLGLTWEHGLLRSLAAPFRILMT